MIKKNKKPKFPSELRYDIVGKDWVVIATGRAKRPEMFKKEGGKRKETSKKDCPFCKLNKGDKSVFVIPNKYPAFIPYPKLEKRKEGKFYQKMNAAGFHEVVITKDHKKAFAQFTVKEIKEVIDVYQARYLDLMNKNFVNHISIFHNYGEEAGASIAHPHSQIITTPLVDVDLNSALVNSEKYFQKTGKCIYCQMNEWEKKSKKRIVFENKDFLAICPFASKKAFQVIISPKKHQPYFEEITEKEKEGLAEVFQNVFKKIYKGLADPDYNFYLHTAPCDGGKYYFYHWHWTILPKTSIWAGFELGAGMEISTIEPEKAAKYLRKQ